MNKTMKTITRATLLFLTLAALAASCNKGDTSSSGSLSGTWAKHSKVAIYENPTDAQKFVRDLGYIVFGKNTVTFMDWDNKEVIGKGTFTYSVTETKVLPEGTVYYGIISFSGVPLQGGSFTRQVSKWDDNISWDDVDDIYMFLRNCN